MQGWYNLLMQKEYLVTKMAVGGELKDIKACLDLIRETGGEVLGFFNPLPGLMPPGFVIRVADEVAGQLNLVEFI